MTGGGVGAAPAVWRFDAIGTGWEVVTALELPGPARAEVLRVIDAFDRAWSRFRGDSTVRGLARRPRAVTAPPDAVPMLDAFAALSEATGGAVNPLVGGSLESRGYDASYSFRDNGAVPAPPDWRELLSWREGVLELHQPATIDVGALGKGRLVDLVLAVVGAAATGDVIVDAGGDLAVRGAPQRIGLEHPFDSRRAIGLWEVTDAALCASATNRRAWPASTGAGLHHVLDARTGEPVRTIAATWAVAGDAMTADAIATALFFDGGPRLAHEWKVEWVRMTTDGRLEWSPGCGADLFVRRDTVAQ
ncbi:FAD:protein FMN transferase [Microbacterium sp. HD4P20]|uniref:FAD:protein FMN transferase n=1 Tax=Microbacterium sp. HD4P20 TaxID=2864874 RepID=UPI001C63CA9B|nr:FAD:protein FMN transferase [Microbacterium sp. HD4P20]MCP2637787.1 FAD:protein FMN transferase [Microbacterium sp. HD4P20]